LADQLVIGIHSVDAVLQQQPERVKRLAVANTGKPRPRLQAILDQAAELGIHCQNQDKKTLDKIVDGNHQGIVAYCTPAKTVGGQDLKSLIEETANPLFLILDGITDPHNLGACLRTADASGVTAVIIPKDNSVGLTTTVQKVACGAAETIPLITVTNLARTMKQLQDLGVWIVGTSGDSEQSIFDIDYSGPTALVMGAEGYGMRRLTSEHCDYLAYIPMAGFVSSLNVSVATGICLFEAVRQRQKKA
jgi:23S rRNA (guanosine2251-2'-O)-methyltransferase